MRYILIHGWGGGPNKDWFPWLAEELKKQGHEVLAPEMPSTDEPTIEKWTAKVGKVVGVPDNETFFVGHSIGCQAILRYLQTIDIRVAGAVFVAGWFNLKNLEDEETEKIAQPWIETPIDIGKIRSVLPKSTLVISDNDPYNCFEENKAKFTELGSDSIVILNGDHLTAEDGFAQFPQLLEIAK
ncbi:hypothetical protein A2755_01580 [Candidatus Wolfebacteria bacterium RIFCSPHIGHO2_01_FULL_48_22]|uniref:Serine hydrolase family protein n=2 Tax=Candidatus Wolfeibacteriota TaxID=1752735 RepID=A0A1F8DQH0_9BACT|nr:MAG: hypothetical protein A2755_01580 [Candidatus Wolfebacteria bacterium RIFCSPHIGHO2_01_FULL_48_22]OGM91928.1 MAG: hypothetical protein A2935_02220 [Candidatus Wolfebacteria bacterium RIFCSPLOWO2_01_FULL_47_17b]